MTQQFDRQPEVIFISNALGGGGAERVLTLLASQMSRSGRKVSILSFKERLPEYSLPSDVEKAYGPTGPGLMTKLKRMLWLRREIKETPHAAIISFEYFVNMQVLIATLGLPNRVLVSERNDPARVGNRFPVGFLREILYRTADVVVCQTRDAAAHFSRRVRTSVILNPVSPDLPEPASGARRRTVVTFCRLEPQKNLGMLIRAFARFHATHPEFSLEIYGNGGERESLMDLARELGISQDVTIRPSRADVHQVVRDCVMFVLPSDYEGLSNSMMEAMSLQLPTISTDCPCGGARMVIRHGENGLLTPVRDVDKLVGMMCRVADDEDFARALGRAAGAIRDEYSLERVTAQWHAALEGSSHS